MPFVFKGCEGCGKYVDIDDQTCPKCGFDFSLSTRANPKCPFCEKELHIYDFFVLEKGKKDQKMARRFLGENIDYKTQMWHCPFCGKILGFSEASTG